MKDAMDYEDLTRAVAAVSDAASQRRWPDASAAATSARTVVRALVEERPEMPADLWVGEEEQEQLAAVAAIALEAGEVDVAVEILAIPETGASESPTALATVLAALRRGDPELALATLLALPASYGGPNVRALARELGTHIAVALDRGTGPQRMLGALAVAINYDSSAEAFEASRKRRADWAAQRSFSDDKLALEYLLVRMCLRRAHDASVFETCAAHYGGNLIAVAPALFEEAAACARRRLDAGGSSWLAFQTHARAAILHGNEAELAERAEAFVAGSSTRQRHLAKSLEWAHEAVSAVPPRGRDRIVLPEGVVHSDLGAFEVDSGVLTVGDPGYTGAAFLRFHVTIAGVKTGTWRARVLRIDVPGTGIRCAALVAHHESQPYGPTEAIWSARGSIDVEYAIAGIFDAAHFYDGVIDVDVVDEARADEHPWYAACARRAHGNAGAYDDRGAGVLPFGCVSSSGLGDGAHECYTARDTDGDIVAVCIDFALQRSAAGERVEGSE